MLGNANVRLGKANYCTLRILLESGAISSTVLEKQIQTPPHKNTQPVKWSTQGGDVLTTYKTNVEFVLPELDVTKSLTWSFHVNDSQKKSRYDMIIGQDLLLEIKLDLCFSDYTIKGKEGAYELCNSPMKDPSDLCDGTRFSNEELWDSEHVLNSTRRTRRILDENCQRANLSKIVSNSKQLNYNKHSMLRDVLKKYEFLFNGTIGTWKTKPVDIEL